MAGKNPTTEDMVGLRCRIVQLKTELRITREQTSNIQDHGARLVSLVSNTSLDTSTKNRLPDITPENDDSDDASLQYRIAALETELLMAKEELGNTRNGGLYLMSILASSQRLEQPKAATWRMLGEKEIVTGNSTPQTASTLLDEDTELMHFDDAEASNSVKSDSQISTLDLGSRKSVVPRQPAYSSTLVHTENVVESRHSESDLQNAGTIARNAPIFAITNYNQPPPAPRAYANPTWHANHYQGPPVLPRTRAAWFHDHEYRKLSGLAWVIEDKDEDELPDYWQRFAMDNRTHTASEWRAYYEGSVRQAYLETQAQKKLDTGDITTPIPLAQDSTDDLLEHSAEAELESESLATYEQRADQAEALQKRSDTPMHSSASVASFQSQVEGNMTDLADTDEAHDVGAADAGKEPESNDEAQPAVVICELPVLDHSLDDVPRGAVRSTVHVIGGYESEHEHVDLLDNGIPFPHRQGWVDVTASTLVEAQCPGHAATSDSNAHGAVNPEAQPKSVEVQPSPEDPASKEQRTPATCATTVSSPRVVTVPIDEYLATMKVQESPGLAQSMHAPSLRGNAAQLEEARMFARGATRGNERRPRSTHNHSNGTYSSPGRSWSPRALLHEHDGKDFSKDLSKRRQVLVQNIPDNITLADIVDKVSGVAIVDARMIDTAGMLTSPRTGKTVILEFLNGEGAFHCAKHCSKQPAFCDDLNGTAHKLAVSLVAAPTRPANSKVLRNIRDHGLARKVFLYGAFLVMKTEDVVARVLEIYLRLLMEDDIDPVFIYKSSIESPLRAVFDQHGVLVMEFANLIDANNAYFVLESHDDFAAMSKGFQAEPSSY